MIPKESQVQVAIEDALTLAGLTVKHTSAFRQKAGSGVSPGVPDLLVFVPELPHLYIGLEVKRDGKAPISPAQKASVAASEYPIVWEPAQALDHVRSVFLAYCQSDCDSRLDRIDRARCAMGRAQNG